MLDVAIRKADGSAVVDWAQVGMRSAPPLPVATALRSVLPGGLRRGATISVTGSLSLLLAVLGAASADGAWCVFVGLGGAVSSGTGAMSGGISAEAADEYGLDLRRVAFVPNAGHSSGRAGGPGGWTTAVGALLDALDIVVARPPARLAPGDVRRLAARARSRDAVLVPYLDPGAEWPGADLRLSARPDAWTGLDAGGGRLRARRVQVSAGGRGTAARARSTQLWLPADGGGVAPVGVEIPAARPLASVVELAS